MGGLNSEILLYHGTASANTDSICKTNFKLDMSVRFAHGRGIYLSRLVFSQARSTIKAPETSSGLELPIKACKPCRDSGKKYENCRGSA